MLAATMSYAPPETTTTTRLAELIATRLCHDITGPIGAINNGVELLADSDPDGIADATMLIESSAKDAVSRVKFYRICYGSPRAGSSMQLSDVQQIFSDYIGDGRTKLAFDWQHPEHLQGSMSTEEVRLSALLVMIGDECLIRGGQVKIGSLSTGGQPQFRLHAEGIKTQMEDANLKQLLGLADASLLSAHNVHLGWTYQIAQQMGLSLRADLSPELTSFTITATRS
ncbi:hypothetical protein GC177_05950 [bacterium]|nr:hypothetical protein [bacterium]